jgi:hypothetical protein
MPYLGISVPTSRNGYSASVDIGQNLDALLFDEDTQLRTKRAEPCAERVFASLIMVR